MNKNKTITIVVALIIILGIIITLTSGFNVNFMTKKHEQILLNLEKQFNVSDIRDITNEIFNGQEVQIEPVEVIEEQVMISTNKITDEQKNNLVKKINEKYGTELKAEEVKAESVPKTKLRDYIIPHIWEMIFATILVVVYECIKYKKLKVLKTLVQTILGIVIVQLLTFSIVAITRIPVGNNIVSIMFVAYIVSVFGLTTMFENKLQKLKLEEGKKKKNAIEVK